MTRTTATAESPSALETEGVDSLLDGSAQGQDQRLDEALEETFPASDPISSSKVD